MKYLTLIRHAKSSHAESSLPDADRPLSERGTRDTAVMGAALAERFPPPGIVLASPAVRVTQTLSGLRGGGAFLPEDVVERHDALYLADAEVIWDYATSALLEYDEAWLVAHNPGLTEAVEQISGARLENVPTLGVVRIAFEEVIMESANGKLVYFDSPAAHRVAAAHHGHAE